MSDNLHFFDKIPQLELFLREQFGRKLLILADEHTAELCVKRLTELTNDKICIMPTGEASKNLETCNAIWNFLSANADRQSTLINVGGGIVTDTGGFAASVYQRGIRFVNVPTSLLGMADASIGGKTGIDFKNYKNYIGSFSFAESTLICPPFLDTLPENEWQNGLAECFKHGLIADEHLFFSLAANNSKQNIINLLEKIVTVKTEIVSQDPREKDLRKILNFGHTVAHALESYYLALNKPISHGRAVFTGMLIEAYLSTICSNLSLPAFETISNSLTSYLTLQFPASDAGQIAAYALKDKKNQNNTLKCSLLTAIGKASYNVDVPIAALQNALIKFGKA